MRRSLMYVTIIMAAGMVREDYPTPEQAGFQHCALIYECEVRGTEQFACYVADETGWLFDAFPFLH